VLIVNAHLHTYSTYVRLYMHMKPYVADANNIELFRESPKCLYRSAVVRESQPQPYSGTVSIYCRRDKASPCTVLFVSLTHFILYVYMYNRHT
jgi:hypothetical protein